MVAVLLIGLGIVGAWYFFRSKEQANASAQLLAQASYIQGQIDATPGPPDSAQVAKMVQLVVAARPDVVEALANLPEDQVGDQALAVGMSLFPGKPYTSLHAAAAFGHAADQLRQARQQARA